MKRKMTKSMMAKLLVLCMCMGLLSPMAVAAAEAGEGEAVIAADEIQDSETTPVDESAGFDAAADEEMVDDVASAEEDVISESDEAFPNQSPKLEGIAT